MRGAALAALLHLGALVRCASKSEWVYAHEPGDYGVHAAQEETWGGTCASGRHQSPIDVQTGLVADGGASLDGGIEPHLETVPMMLINNGHAFQLHKTEPGYHPDPEGTDTALGRTSKGHTFLRGQRYNFYQVHWHAPSENTIDGKLYAMEAHFVHQLDDSEWGGDGSLVGTLVRIPHLHPRPPPRARAELGLRHAAGQPRRARCDVRALRRVQRAARSVLGPLPSRRLGRRGGAHEGRDHRSAGARSP